MPNDTKAAEAAIYAVAEPIVAATRHSDHAVLTCAAAITALVTERRIHNLPLGTGAAELPKLALALLKHTEAREATINARLALVRIPRTLHVQGFGPQCPCDTAQKVSATAAPLDVGEVSVPMEG